MHLPHLERSPHIHPSVYVDPTARINGDVTIGEEASVWFHASIRGDVHWIRIGPRTSVQDHCALHTTHERFPLEIGPEIVIGHGAVLHGCTLAGRSLIGMGAILLDGCLIEEEVIVGAGSLVPQGRVMPAGHLVMGSPAKPVRPLTETEREAVRNGWRNYADYVAEYRRLGKFHGWADHPLQDR
jgi:carbonic anhydrase/acetyltransferase-like protein (isoleucine patch superfamily)